MYARRLKSKCKKWDLMFQPYRYFIESNCSYGTCCQPLRHMTIEANCSPRGGLTRRYISWSGSKRLHVGSDATWRSNWLRFYSSEGDGRNAGEDKCVPVKNVSTVDCGNIKDEKINADISHFDGHARLGEQDQKEWLYNEKIAIENKRKEFPFMTRRERFRKEFSRRILPWEKITVSWKTFPYYLNEHTKNLLLECTASHLKHKDCTAAYGSSLTSSSGRILLQSIPGTELYRERLVRALAQDLQVPLLVLDSSALAPYDGGEDCLSETEADDDNAETGEETTSDSEVEGENDASDEEEWPSSSEAKSDGTGEEIHARAAAVEAALNKLIPGGIEEFEKHVLGTSENPSASSAEEAVKSSDKSKKQLQKGDRVKYVGPTHTEADSRIILGKIPTSDGPTNAYTIIHSRSNQYRRVFGRALELRAQPLGLNVIV